MHITARPHASKVHAPAVQLGARSRTSCWACERRSRASAPRRAPPSRAALPDTNGKSARAKMVARAARPGTGFAGALSGTAAKVLRTRSARLLTSSSRHPSCIANSAGAGADSEAEAQADALMREGWCDVEGTFRDADLTDAIGTVRHQAMPATPHGTETPSARRMARSSSRSLRASHAGSGSPKMPQ